MEHRPTTHRRQGGEDTTAFERYMLRKRGATPAASIWVRGQIGINTGAIRTYDLEQMTHAALFFDAPQQQIGIAFLTSGHEGHCLKVTHRPTCFCICAAGFLDHYAIPHRVARRYALVFDTRAQLYVMRLCEPIPYPEEQTS